MNSLRRRWANLSDRQLSILVAVVLALIWTNNPFHFRISSIYGVFDPTSEALVVGRLGRAAAEGINSQGASLGTNLVRANNPDPGKYPEQIKFFEHPELIKADGAEFGPYLSQFGLQASFFALIDKLNPLPRQYRIGLYHFLTALACAAVVMWIVSMISRRFGRAAGIGFVAPLFVEPLFPALAPNLYWASPLWFLPMALAMCLVDVETPRLKRWLVVLVGLVVMAKALSGYEFVTTVIIAAMVGCLLNAKEDSLHDHVVDMFWILIAGIAGVVSAIVLHGVKFSFGNILQRAITRTTGGSDTLQEELLVGKFVSVSSVLRAYFAANEYTLIRNFGLLFALLGVIALLTFAERKYSWLFIDNRGKLRSLALAYLVSFAAPLSWFILAKAHAFAHRPIDFILWYVPTLPIGAALAGLAIREAWVNRQEWYRSRFRSVLTLSLPAALLMVFALVAALDRTVNERGVWILQAHFDARQIFADRDIGVDFRFNDNWFFVEYACDRTSPSDVFYIHAFNGDAPTNYDFRVGDQVVATPSKGRCFYARPKSPEPITRIEFGLVSSRGIVWRHESTL